MAASKSGKIEPRQPIGVLTGIKSPHAILKQNTQFPFLLVLLIGKEMNEGSKVLE